jgi:hypothetical protein
LLTDAASVVVVGDRENDIYSCFARRPAGVDLIVRAAQDRALVEDASLFASAAAWPELTQMLVKVAPRRVGDPGRIATVALRARPVTLKRPRNGFAKTCPSASTTQNGPTIPASVDCSDIHMTARRTSARCTSTIAIVSR